MGPLGVVEKSRVGVLLFRRVSRDDTPEPAGTRRLNPLSKSGIVRVGMSTPFRFKRVWLRYVSALAAMALLFAQISVAAYACPNLGKGSTGGIGGMAEQYQHPSSGPNAQHPSLCHEHCKPQMSVDHVQVAGVPPAMPSGLVLPVVDVHPTFLSVRYAGSVAAQVKGPPRSILFCVFRT